MTGRAGNELLDAAVATGWQQGLEVSKTTKFLQGMKGSLTEDWGPMLPDVGQCLPD
jgi:hypothetical protein